MARPVSRCEIIADGVTPIAAYRVLAALRPGISFLFESAPGPQQTSRYSIIGLGAKAQVRAVDGVTHATVDGSPWEELGDDVLSGIRSTLARVAPSRDAVSAMPLLGAYGAAAFELAGYFERLPRLARGDDPMPDLHLVVPETLVAFDHFSHKLTVATLGDGEGRTRDDGDIVAAVSSASIPPLARPREPGALHAVRGAMPFSAAVAQAKEAIAAGEAFQIVVSQRWLATSPRAPFDAYRALRAINPSPYMFYLDLGWGQLFGSSPEILARLKRGRAQIRPLAGTRPRSEDPDEERKVAWQLVRDPKERAEHVMLVDLGRNDLGRVCRYGSVRVRELLAVELYSHVMHLVSDIAGTLREECDALDLLAAAFPAGTTSGAPKIRAMELIAELEGRRRGFYAGTVGHFGFDGSMDACITLRSTHAYGGFYHLQAGAGIVADSIAENEDRECRSKARALVEALGAVEGAASP